MNTFSRNKLAAAVLFAGAAAGLAQPAQPAEPDIKAHQPEIDQIVHEISPDRIKAYVKKLVSFETRHTMSDTVSNTRGIGAARRWIQSELESCGAAAGGRLKITLDSHIHPVAPRISRPTEVVDVVATLPGSQAASVDRIYVVSGHYDSRVTDIMDAASTGPGANDDASGTAAVMELACVMAKHKFDATLVFMAVAGEEQGLLGAEHFAQVAKEKNLNIAGMLNNDIIGSSMADDGHRDASGVRLFAEGVQPKKEMSEEARRMITTGGENDSIARQLARYVKEIGERYVDGFKVNIVYRRDRYLRGGDQSPFLDRGWAAVRFTELNENFDHQHQDLRTENGRVYGDLTEFVDFDYIAQVARVNAASLASLALAPAAPQNVVVRTAKLDNNTDLDWAPNTEPDLAGYRVVWRETTAPLWQGSTYVGNATRFTSKLSKDNYLFGVQAVDKDGNVSPAVYPVPVR